MLNKIIKQFLGKKSIILFSVALLVSQLMGYSLLDIETGNEVGCFDARATAMGSATSGGSNNFLTIDSNPAILANLNKTMGIQFSSGFMRNQDTRSLPMYDSFDGFVGDAEYVSNENIFNEIAVGGFYKVNSKEASLAFGIQYRPYTNFDAAYDEEIRNNSNSDYNSYPPIIAKNYIRGDGSINGLSFSLGYNYKFVSLGFEATKLSGEQNYARKLLWSDYANSEATTAGYILADEVFEISRDFDGTAFNVGIITEINKYLSAGFSYKPEINLEATIDTLTVDFFQPGKYRAGLLYHPRSFIHTSLNCDAEYVAWNSINSLFEDELNYYIGVEHIINNNLPFRMGFNYKTDYQMIFDDNIEYANKIIMPTFTAGTGFKFLNNFSVDLSFQYSYRMYETLDLFHDTAYDYDFLWDNYTYLNLEDRGWENPDKVTETFVKFQTSISYNW